MPMQGSLQAEAGLQAEAIGRWAQFVGIERLRGWSRIGGD
jgi:hypothetical protein